MKVLVHMTKKNINTLTSLRFIAVMLIVVHHLRQEFIPSLLRNENFGILGVTFFLILSGFVINLSYGRMTRTKECLFFLWNRVVRIYPLHILTLITCVLIFLLSGAPVHLSTALINGILLQAFFPYKSIYFSFNSLSWILSTLLFFYLMFSMGRMIPRLFSFIIVMSVSSLLVSIYFIETNPQGQVLWFRLWLLYIFPPNRLVIIFLGVGASLVFKSVRSHLSDQMGILSATMLETLALLLTIDFLAWGYVNNFVVNALLTLKCPIVLSLDLLIKNYISSPLPVLTLILIFALEKGMLSRALQTRTFVFLGDMSFSIFITHQLVINYALSYYKNSLFSAFGQPLTLVFNVIVILGVSLPAYIVIEKPLRTRLRASGAG